jgi:hypothetical protein
MQRIFQHFPSQHYTYTIPYIETLWNEIIVILMKTNAIKQSDLLWRTNFYWINKNPL